MTMKARTSLIPSWLPSVVWAILVAIAGVVPALSLMAPEPEGCPYAEFDGALEVRLVRFATAAIDACVVALVLGSLWRDRLQRPGFVLCCAALVPCALEAHLRVGGHYGEVADKSVGFEFVQVIAVAAGLWSLYFITAGAGTEQRPR